MTHVTQLIFDPWPISQLNLWLTTHLNSDPWVLKIEASVLSFQSRHYHINLSINAILKFHTLRKVSKQPKNLMGHGRLTHDPWPIGPLTHDPMTLWPTAWDHFNSAISFLSSTQRATDFRYIWIIESANQWISEEGRQRQHRSIWIRDKEIDYLLDKSENSQPKLLYSKRMFTNCWTSIGVARGERGPILAGLVLGSA